MRNICFTAGPSEVSGTDTLEIVANIDTCTSIQTGSGVTWGHVFAVGTQGHIVHGSTFTAVLLHTSGITDAGAIVQAG